MGNHPEPFFLHYNLFEKKAFISADFGQHKCRYQYIYDTPILWHADIGLFSNMVLSFCASKVYIKVE